MNSQLILLILITIVIGTEAFATNNNLKQENNKTQELKYDFNIFKFYSIVTTPELPDSIKTKAKTYTQYKKED